MKKIIFAVAIMMLATFMLAPAAFTQETPDYTVDATDAAIELMREKGTELYVRMGTYRGI